MSEDEGKTDLQTVRSLVATLAAIDLVAVVEDPAALAQAIIERQHTLDQLKSFPLSAVPEDERAALKAELSTLLARDEEILSILAEAREGVGAQLQQLVSGRALVRSYGGLSTGGASSVKRTG